MLLLDKMTDNSTCKVGEISINSGNPEITESSGGIKRSLYDDIKIEDDDSNKKLKTELDCKV